MRDGAEPPPPAQGEDDELTATALDATGDMPDVVVRSWWAALRGARARAAALGATALLVVVVAAGLVAHSASDPGEIVSTLLGLPTPTPAATMVPGDNLIYASDGAPWGTLTIDGKRMPTVDMLGNGFTVSHGAHHLVYQARYFPTLRCVFSAPPATSDTCPLDTSSSANQFVAMHGHGRVLDLGSTGLTLQRDQRVALTVLANSILAAQHATATIEPGDHYLDGQGRVVTATAPLRFTVMLALDGGPTPGGSLYCAQFCPDPSFSADGVAHDQQWLTRVMVAATWAITDASGRRLSGLTYQAGQLYPESAPLEVGVQLTPTGWKISGLEQQSYGFVNSAAMAAASQLVNAVNSPGYGMSVQAGQDALQGCVVGLTYAGKSVRLLWRFGALLALDSAAHKLFPQLPIATAAEQALAARIVPQPQHP